MCALLTQNDSTVMSCQAALNMFPFDFPVAITLPNSFLVRVPSLECVLIKDQHT